MNTGSLIAENRMGNLRLWARLAVAITFGVPLAGLVAAPAPVADIRFTEPEGSVTFANVGSLGGTAYLYGGDGTGFPMLSALVPQGPFAPSNNARSLDMGPIEAGHGDRAVDLATALGPFGSWGRSRALR
jgi:hypothetical protein